MEGMAEQFSVVVTGRGVTDTNDDAVKELANKFVKDLQAMGLEIKHAVYVGCGGETVLPLYRIVLDDPKVL